MPRALPSDVCMGLIGKRENWKKSLTVTVSIVHIRTETRLGHMIARGQTKKSVKCCCPHVSDTPSAQREERCSRSFLAAGGHPTFTSVNPSSPLPAWDLVTHFLLVIHFLGWPFRSLFTLKPVSINCHTILQLFMYCLVMAHIFLWDYCSSPFSCVTHPSRRCLCSQSGMAEPLPLSSGFLCLNFREEQTPPLSLS